MPSLSSFFPTVKPGNVFLHDERRDALVSRRWIDRRQQDEHARFLGVRDPQLLPIQDIVVALQLGPRRERERVRAGARFAQRIGADGVAAHARQIALPLLFRRPAQQRVVDQRVLHINHNARRRIDARQLFHRQDGLEEAASSSAVLLGDLDAHQSKLKELLDDRGLEDALLVHLLHMRADGFFRELANRVAKKNFIFGERDQRSGRGRGGLYRSL